MVYFNAKKFCKTKFFIINYFIIFFVSAFALKGIEYDHVPVNLIKDGGQQVKHNKIKLSFANC